MSFDDRLEKRSLNRAMRNLGATLVTPPSMISAARINGIDLLALVQDYVLDGVKVQFFVNPRARRLSSEALNIAGWRFKLMAPAGLFALKSALLLRRARSRDYFDLMWFCTHAGKTLEDIVEAARLEDDSPEVPAVVEHKLLGLIPVDPDDEGLDPLGPNLSLGDIYRFFEAEVSRREVATARALLANARRGPSES